MPIPLDYPHEPLPGPASTLRAGSWGTATSRYGRYRTAAACAPGPGGLLPRVCRHRRPPEPRRAGAGVGLGGSWTPVLGAQELCGTLPIPRP